MSDETILRFLLARPLFVIGAPRSGTTLITRILNSHPRIVLTNEAAVFLQLYDNISKSRIGVTAGVSYGKEYNELWARHLESNAKKLIQLFYYRIAVAQRKRNLAYWGEKHPHLSDYFDPVSTMFPDAIYVNVVRNVRDTVCSISKMNGVSIREAIEIWKDIMDKNEKFMFNLNNNQVNVITAKYEDFLLDYETSSANLLEQLGLEMHDDVHAYLKKYRNIDMHSFDDIHNLHALTETKYREKSTATKCNELSECDAHYLSEVSVKFREKYSYEP